MRSSLQLFPALPPLPWQLTAWPWHNGNSTHLPLYNVTDAYREAVGDAPIGGFDYKTQLCLMRKPVANESGLDVGFLVNVGIDGRSVNAEQRCLGGGHEASM